MKYFWNIYILLLLVSCYPNGNPEEKTEEADAPDLRQNTGGDPNESSFIGMSPFFAPPRCKEGFGMCTVEIQQPSDANPSSASKYYDATFHLSTNTDILRIEFNQPIPHYSSKFVVSGTDSLKNTLGHSFIIPVAGEYKTAEKNSTYPNGSVEIKVIKGSPDSSFQ